MTKKNNSDLSTLIAHPDTPESLKQALERDDGAQFYRCALQVNPFDYIKRHSKSSSFEDEASYNKAMVKACLANEISIVALTDHFRFDSSVTLSKALENSGIHVFPGFEANSSEGIHLLCLFPPGEEASNMNLHIGACGVSDFDDESPHADKKAEEIADIIASRGGLTIAAHVCSANGLLTVLSGKARARVWKSDNLSAAAIAGNPNDVPAQHQQIVLNKDIPTKRKRPLSLINAGDISDPKELSKNGMTSLIKMSKVSIEGLRQAFLDSDSRIRLNSDGSTDPHSKIVAISWDGGLLDEQCMRLNGGLNVLVGGRGSGKSTVIESLRYAFDMEPHCSEAQRIHKSILKAVIKPGTEISVLVHSPNPFPQHYLIRRVYGNDPYVFDQTGDLIEDLRPLDILGDIEIYGQHEISELTREPTEIADILKRFVPLDDGADDEIVSSLDGSAASILDDQKKLERLDASLSTLPELKDKLKRFKSLGLDKQLQSKTLIDEESGIFDQMEEEIKSLQSRVVELCPEDLYMDILPEEYEKKFPNAATLKSLGLIQDRIIAASERAKNYLEAVVEQTTQSTADLKKDWDTEKTKVEKDYTKILKDLSKEGIDGAAYISVRDQLAKILPKEKQKKEVIASLEVLKKDRKKLLAKFEVQTAEELRSLEKAAKRVSKRLKGKVKVEVRVANDLTSLEKIIRQHVTGQISQAMGKLQELDAISMTDLAIAIRVGAESLKKNYGFSQSSAEKLSSGGENLALAIEQHHLPAEAVLSLNVGDMDNENWKSIDQLSTGQKATAVLLLLLLEADGPLIIDQPEDDLDNRFIVGSVVSAIRGEKVGRQFLFASHNANIPVLGDAEQIVGLTPTVEDGFEVVQVQEELCGSIDSPEVKNLVKDLLEGGQTAFEFRREKYGF